MLCCCVLLCSDIYRGKHANQLALALADTNTPLVVWASALHCCVASETPVLNTRAFPSFSGKAFQLGRKENVINCIRSVLCSPDVLHLDLQHGLGERFYKQNSSLCGVLRKVGGAVYLSAVRASSLNLWARYRYRDISVVAQDWSVSLPLCMCKLLEEFPSFSNSFYLSCSSTLSKYKVRSWCVIPKGLLLMHVMIGTMISRHSPAEQRAESQAAEDSLSWL